MRAWILVLSLAAAGCGQTKHNPGGKIFSGSGSKKKDAVAVAGGGGGTSGGGKAGADGEDGEDGKGGKGAGGKGGVAGGDGSGGASDCATNLEASVGTGADREPADRDAAEPGAADSRDASFPCKAPPTAPSPPQGVDGQSGAAAPQTIVVARFKRRVPALMGPGLQRAYDLVVPGFDPATSKPVRNHAFEFERNAMRLFAHEVTGAIPLRRCLLDAQIDLGFPQGAAVHGVQLLSSASLCEVSHSHSDVLGYLYPVGAPQPPNTQPVYRMWDGAFDYVSTVDIGELLVMPQPYRFNAPGGDGRILGYAPIL